VKKYRVRTVVLSDIHLGTVDSKVAEVNHFLRHVRCEKLILNGDIIDGWQLKRNGQWTKAHTHFIRIVLKMLEKRDTQIVYLRGNHDDILSKFLPLEFENLLVADEYLHEGPKGRYLVLHGDVFDTVTRNFVFLAHLGDWGYHMLLAINRAYNVWRSWRGLEYWSLSRAIKARVKSAVNHVSNFEEHIAELARARGCVGVMCGHIHTPADKMLGDIHYLNSGDWIESLTAIVEHWDGRYELLEYKDFLREFPMPAEENAGEGPAPDPGGLEGEANAEVAGPGAGPREEHMERYPGGAVRAAWGSRIGANGDYVLDGRETWFAPDGRRHYEVDYAFGHKVGRETLWRADGGVAWTWNRRPDGTGTWIRYWENGRKRTQSEWRGLRAEGEATRWEPDGQVAARYRFSGGFAARPPREEP